jgi:GYD domain
MSRAQVLAASIIYVGRPKVPARRTRLLVAGPGVVRAVEGLGGKLERIYYTFGAADVLAVVDMPDNVSIVCAVGRRLGQRLRSNQGDPAVDR